MDEQNANIIKTEQTSPAESQQAEQGKFKPNFTPEQQEFVNKLVDTQYAKFQAKADKKLVEIQEAEKLKSMSEEERAKAELNNYKQKVVEYERQQLVSQFKVELTEKGLPSKYAQIIPVADAEAAKAAVEFLSGYVEEVKQPLNKRIAELEEQLKNASLRGTPPKSVTTAIGVDGVTAAFLARNPKLKV